MPTQVIRPDVSDPLHIFPPNVCFTFQVEDIDFGLHVIFVLMQQK